MSADLLCRQEPSPFWFVSTDLLMDLLSAELRLVGSLFAENPQLPDWCDSPRTATEQRGICFAVAARGKAMENMSETIASRHEPSGPLNDEESTTFQLISNLIASDAPMWAREMNQVAERMPSHMPAALPDSLRTERFDETNPKQENAIKAFSTLEHIQAFIQTVLDGQWKRLEERWPSTIKSRRTNKRKGWETRERLYGLIRQVLAANPSLQGSKFCAELDNHHALPLYDWVKKNGEWREGLTWKEAWDNSKLRDRIRRVRQEAMQKS
jgi:hypothetical protein